jgi:ribosomal protein S18 acetylase RimI-like enzyme
MQITIQEFNAHNCDDLNRCNSAFTVDSKLILRADNGIPTYTIVSIPPYAKQYPRSEIEYDHSLAQPDRGVFFAYADGQLAGQIILSRNWNGYAYVDDIAVDAGFRQQGIGRALVHQAIMWAKARQLPGVMLETQNTNVGACLFYQQCGFELGGFDRYLYRGLDADTQEIALYWYLIFQEADCESPD